MTFETMNINRFRELESAVLARNPLLTDKLQPGLSRNRIQRILKRAGVEGEIGPLIELYSWRNGTILDRDLASSKTGFFPDDIYQFLDLEMAMLHFGSWREAANYHPNLRDGVGRYVPMFWDGATGWLAMDTNASAHNRLVFVEFEDPEPYREVYSSFDEFLADAIRANIENERLSCFQSM